MTELEDYHCENCKNFNETEIPANCLRGKGKVAFRHPICPEFTASPDKKEFTKNEGS